MKDFTQEELVDLRIAVGRWICFLETQERYTDIERLDKLWDKLYGAHRLGRHSNRDEE